MGGVEGEFMLESAELRKLLEGSTCFEQYKLGQFYQVPFVIENNYS